jgi:hypothetical protein
MLGKVADAAIVALVCLQSVASAAGITFNNRAAFEAAIGSHRTLTFEPADGFPVAPAPIMFLDGVFPQASSNGGPASLDIYGAGNQALTGRLNDLLNRSTVVTIAPAPGTLAMGFDILDLGAPVAEQATISISDGSDRISFPFHVQDTDGNPATPVFFGVIWDMDITFVDIYAENLLCAGPGICYTPNLIDNLTLVPEPGAALLALVGAFALRRRARHASPLRAPTPVTGRG